ncbi:MAG: hypothetical protein H7287_10020 [Thermoleophilia bacterium]|nr:hypothetical protein [Thermoleophilia bacterium]
MADEQTPQSDLIEDALRKAERQLEERLAAFQLTALGEPAARDRGEDDPSIATMRPTHTSDPTPADDDLAAATGGWRETEGDDVRFEPVLGDVFSATVSAAPAASTAPPLDAIVAPSNSVTDLIASWDAEDEAPLEELAPPAATTPLNEPRSTWTSSDAAYEPAPTRRPATQPSTTPSEDELQFWAQTRTALRNLQQVTDVLPSQIVGNVSDHVERIVRLEIRDSTETIHAVQQQLGNDLPKLAERIEGSIESQVSKPVAGIRLLREELTTEVDRGVHETRSGVREDLDHAASAIHGAVQQDVAQLEQSVATNVTRMTQVLTDSVQRVERDVENVGETVGRFERGVHGEFDRVESQLRTAIERVDQTLRDELVEPTATIRKLDAALPGQFDRVERNVLEQVQGSQRDLASVLTGLVDANRASLDRIASIASTLDEDRSRRSDDLDVVVDTMTTGWSGLAGAVKALYEQGEQIGFRIDVIEQRMEQMRDLEKSVETTMQEFRDHVKDLTPAPVVVTVSHPEAQVSSTSRGGWLPTDSAK